MTDRALKIYQGEDLSPVTDLTDMAIWETSEWGSRAYLGEAASAQVVIRDENGVTGSGASLPAGLSAISLAAGNVVEFTHGSNVLWRGRMASKNYSRGMEKGGRYREADSYLEDVNIDLRDIVVHGWVRGTESDVARAQALVATYLSGSPRRTTVVNGSNLVVTSSNTVVMPAKTYNQTDVEAILAELSRAANKTYYLLPRRHTSDAHTAELVYDGNDALIERCPFHITDRESEVRASPDHYFFPIFNVGPAATENGQELISGVWLFYGPGQNDYVHVEDATQANLYAHREIVLFDDTVTTAAEATRAANATLSFRKYEERTINVTIGPLTDAHVGVIRQGQTIGIKSKAIPFADDAEYEGKISNFTLTTYAPGRYFAHLQIDRPTRLFAYGTGTKPTVGPPDGGCTLLDQATYYPKMDGEELWNGPWADGGDGLGNTGLDPHSGSACLNVANSLSNPWSYYVFGGTWTAGRTYTLGLWTKANAATIPVTFTFGYDSGTSYPVFEDSVNFTISATETAWTYHEMVWTAPSTIASGGAYDSAGVKLLILAAANSDGVGLDDATVQECSDAESPISIGGPGEGTVGEGTGNTIPPGTVIEHGDLSGKGGTMHDDTQIEGTDPGSHFTTTTVAGQLDELADDIAAIGGVTISTNTPLVDGAAGDPGDGTAASADDHVHPVAKLDDLATPDDNTDLNASTSKHGLLPKLGGGTTNYLRADGTWNAPGGAGVTLSDDTPLVESGTGDEGTSGEASRSDHVHPEAAGGGGSTGWTKLIDADDMSALTNWTVRSGTWTAGGTYGVNQTGNDQDDSLECNENLGAYSYRAIQATIRLTNTGKVGFGFSDSGGWGGGDVAIALDDGNDDVWWDRFGIGGSTANFTVAQNTDYVLLVVERAGGSFFSVYVDGVFQTNISVSTGNLGRVALYCRNGAGWFRDVTVWGWSTGVPT